MNQELLLKHFNRISDAPTAIPRLRRFILDLAVRGKLVAQEPTDEPALQLLARIQAEQAPPVGQRAAKAGFGGDVRLDERPFTLPKGWEWVRLGDRLEMINGRAFKPTEWLPKGLPIARIQNLNDERASFNYCDESTVEPRHVINSGSFLISWSGTPGTSFGAFIWLRGKAALNQHIFSCFQRGEAYFDHFLRLAINGRLDEMIAKAHGGVGLQHITKGKLENLPLPMPPLSEQRRIVAKVDELNALCDHLEATKAKRESERNRLVAASLHHMNHGPGGEGRAEGAQFYLRNLPRLTTDTDHIQQLRRTILDLAVRGRLVPQALDDEPASELLKQIQEEKAHCIKTGEAKEQKRHKINAPDEVPFGVPSTWRWVSLGEIAFGFRYGTSIKCTYEPAGEPVLRIPNVHNGRINTEDLKFGPLSKREADDLRLQLGDILMVRSNGSLDLVGRPALVEASAVGYCYAGYLVRVRTSVKYLDTRYLLLALTTPQTRSQIEIPIRTTVGLKNVNATELSGLAIPLPPLGEQHRIVAKVDELMMICDGLEAQLTIAQTESRRLLEAVLGHALNNRIEQSASILST